MPAAPNQERKPSPSRKKATSLSDVQLNIRAKRADVDRIDQAALYLGQTRTEFMLSTARKAADDVLMDKLFFELDEDQYARFIERLDAPARPNPGLRELMARTPLWER